MGTHSRRDVIVYQVRDTEGFSLMVATQEPQGKPICKLGPLPDWYIEESWRALARMLLACAASLLDSDQLN